MLKFVVQEKLGLTKFLVSNEISIPLLVIPPTLSLTEVKPALPTKPLLVNKLSVFLLYTSVVKVILFQKPNSNAISVCVEVSHPNEGLPN